MTETVGKVNLNLDYYCGEDLYSDGDVIENRILDIVKNDSGYEYCHKDFTNWAILYHLSRQRENIVEPMTITKADTILEVGAGMGAITGELSRRGKQVDCIELSKRRSLVNAYRHKQCDNINIYVGNFQDVEITQKYDVITLIGVLEYAYHYINDDNPYDAFIKKIATCLRPNGKLYIAIENKLGMKYFAGYHEDHLGIPFKGIEGYCKEDKVKTFTKSQLQCLMMNNGFVKTKFYYPFPDYKLPTVIYDDETIKTFDVQYANQINYDMDVRTMFKQNLAFKSLKGTDEIDIFANSFLVEGIKG